MNKVLLKEIVNQLESGARPKGGALDSNSSGIPSLGAEHLNNSGTFNFSNLKHIPLNFYKDLKAGKIKKNDILIVKDGATTGKTCFVDDTFPYIDAAINEHVFRLNINSNIANPQYIFHFLKTKYGQNELLKDFRGATVGGISRKILDIVKIPLPPLEDQIRIANLLSRIEGLIAKRKESIRFLDEFVKSTFLEMFGDPVRNEKGWDVKPLGKIGQFISGGTPSKEHEDFWNGNLPWVSPKDMKVPYIFDSQDHISEKVFHETSLKRINPGHILIVVRGMILAHSFPVAINMVQVSINQDMKAIHLEEGINARYMINCLISMKRLMLSSITTAGHGTKRFDSDVMNKIMVPVPPLPMQSKYTTIVEKVEALKLKYTSGLSELERLYGAVSQKVFRGEI